MSLVAWLIVSSFVALVVAVLGYAGYNLWPRYAWLKRIYPIAGLMATVLYAVAALWVFFDGQGWNTFKTEVAELLAVYIIATVSFFMAEKRPTAGLTHSIILVVLLVLVLIMHLKWSGLLA